MATVRIPTPLRKITNGKEEVAAAGHTVAELIADLEKSFPGMKDRICDDKGQLRRFVNIFANDEDIRFLQNLDTPVKDTDEISIVPAIAGGLDGPLRPRAATGSCEFAGARPRGARVKLRPADR